MADVTTFNCFHKYSHFRWIVPAAFLLFASFGWSQQLSYVPIQREHQPTELSNQYNVIFLGSSFGTTMTTRPHGSSIEDFLRSFFRDRRTRGSLQVEYELKRSGNQSRHSIGIYERYEKDDRRSSLRLSSRSVSTEFLSVVNSRFRTGVMLPEDSLTLTVTLASYSSEIALGIEAFIDSADLENFGVGDTAEAKFALASHAIAAFSRDRTTLSAKTVALYGSDLLENKYIVFYLATPGRYESSDLIDRLAEKIGENGPRGEINTNLVSDAGWFGNAVFLIEREVTPCDRNERQESKDRCHAVSNFMREWVNHITATDGTSSNDARELAWRYDGSEESGKFSEFFDMFDLSYAIGNYGKVDDDRWSAKGAIWVDDFGATRGAEGQQRCLKDVSVKFTFERESANVTRAELDIGVHPLADGRRPSSDAPEKYQCKD